MTVVTASHLRLLFCRQLTPALKTVNTHCRRVWDGQSIGMLWPAGPPPMAKNASPHDISIVDKHQRSAVRLCEPLCRRESSYWPPARDRPDGQQMTAHDRYWPLRRWILQARTPAKHSDALVYVSGERGRSYSCEAFRHPRRSWRWRGVPWAGAEEVFAVHRSPAGLVTRQLPGNSILRSIRSTSWSWTPSGTWLTLCCTVLDWLRSWRSREFRTSRTGSPWGPYSYR